MEPGEREMRRTRGEKEGRSDREGEGAVPGAIVLSVSCWRGRTKKTGGLWRITCLSHSL